MVDFNPKALRSTLLSSDSKDNYFPGNYPKIDCRRTGLPYLDYLIRGGFPKGRVIEIYGKNHSGKTALALFYARQRQLQGQAVGWLDLECALDVDGYVSSIIDTHPDKFWYFRPANGEEALNIFLQLANGGIDTTIGDSLPLFLPQVTAEAEVGSRQYYGVAGLMAANQNRIIHTCATTGMTMIFLNQQRDNIGVTYGAKTTQPGGHAIKHLESIRIEIARISDVRDMPGAIISRLKIAKSRLGGAQATTDIEIHGAAGISPISNMVDALLHLEFATQKGSFYYLKPEHIPEADRDDFRLGPKGVTMGQGMKKVIAFFDKHKKLYYHLYSLIDMKVKEELTLSASTQQEELDKHREVNLNLLVPADSE